MINANDSLRHHSCADHYYKYMHDMVVTDGVMALAEKFECFWFLDIIASYQPRLHGEDFQVWKLIRKDGSSEANVVCENGNGRQLVKQYIPFTDFKSNEATVWIELGVALLPSEH